MADFFQNGVISTLQKLKERPLGGMDAELESISGRRGMVLLLPALFSEFETPSMPRIIEELKGIKYLRKIVLSLDRANGKQFREAREKLSVLPADVKVVWHDGPLMEKLYKELKKNAFNLGMPGKGRSVWMTLGYILSQRDIFAIALHDCDIVNYRREIVSRLFYPVVHPAMNIEFSKGYYARVTDKLYGRVWAEGKVNEGATFYFTLPGKEE